MSVLEERGYFWWNEERVKPDHFAADGYVPGLLKIDDEGRITLELDGCLPSQDPRVPRFFSGSRGEASAKNIQGKLRGSGKYALLLGAWDDGGQFSTGGISFERYYAPRCLVSDSRFPSDGNKVAKFRRLVVDLKGYENWLWLNGIQISRTKRSITTRYQNVRDHKYDIEQGSLRIEYDLMGPYIGRHRESETTLKQLARIHFTPNEAIEAKHLEEFYLRIVELLILLSDSNANLDWPQIVSADGKRYSRLYFQRYKTESKAPAKHECLIHFPKIADDFGTIFSNWLRKREQFGPGFYLYLGTRRGVKLYIEHRFVNLIWGLEALDRIGKQEEVHPPLAAKLKRILEAVPKKDRPWLEDRLQHAAEPSLGERLARTLRPIPLPLDDKALKSFCAECAKLRNDISHFGGDHHGRPDYRRFMRELDDKSDALASMYHVLLLSEIGVKPDLFDPNTNRGWPMSTIMRHLRTAKLVKPEST